ncbi:hypothetical protein E4K10_18110 [Streptomyces sp. T1317-0309]|nr:hypothetical protein E4K10_18110 [Streptomyces sp. T1317-0309]
MPRKIGADGTTVYRAVITFENADGRTWTEYEGPYTQIGHARGRIPFWALHMRKQGGTAGGTVEQAHTVWTPVDSDADPYAELRAIELENAAQAAARMPMAPAVLAHRGIAAQAYRRAVNDVVALLQNRALQTRRERP